MDSKYNSRKFFFATSLTTISTLALITSKIQAKDWIDINKWIYVTYVTSNVTQKMSIK